MPWTAAAIVLAAAVLVYNSGHLVGGGPMLSSLPRLSLALWFAGIFAQFALVLILVHRRSFKSFPWFTAYMIQANISSVMLVAIAMSSGAWLYGACFYAASIIDSLMALLAVCEFLALTFPRPARPQRMTAFIAIAMGTAYLIVGSIGKVFLSENPWRQSEQLFIALSAATLWVFLILKERLSLYWGSRTSAVGRGMSVYLTAEVITTFASGLSDRQWIGSISQVAYLVSVAIWIVGFAPQCIPPQAPSLVHISQVRSVLTEERDLAERIESARRGNEQ